jgi:DNA-binding NtrC family response regulator
LNRLRETIMNATILLIDDEPNVLLSLSRALRREPYQVFTARSANEAMQIVKTHTVDLIISDEIMPGMQGTEFLAWVAGNLPGVVRIILTGRPLLVVSELATRDCGVFRLFTKPAPANEILAAIREALEKRSVPAAGETD